MSALVDELATIVGMPGTKAMCAWWGGQRLYVPKQAPSDGPLVELLGGIVVARLVKRFGGDYLELPMPSLAAARRAEMRRLLTAGYMVAEIAPVLGITLRRARQMFAEIAASGSISP